MRFKSPTGSEDFEVAVIAPTAIARRAPFELVLLDGKEGVSVYGKQGQRLWQRTHPDCGAVDRMATDAGGAIVFVCGYSVIRFSKDGELSWQKRPLGNKHLRGPWLDEQGNAYISGGGVVASVKPDGELRWKLSTGFNRAISEIAWNARGNMVFDTGMDALHSDGDEFRFYYDQEPNELFEVTRDGVIVARETHEGIPAKGWPAVRPLPEDKAHRIPD
ncbi:MAG: hypothetical protein JNK04_10390 [Myxococcales bacterium]|nr:hypothetical protein [Myxococcales bacterium]